MSYKIVQQQEETSNGEIVLSLTIVPEAWAHETFLYWPNHPNEVIKLMVRDKYSLPGEDWEQQECVVRCAGIELFEDAEIQLAALLNDASVSLQEDNASNTMETEGEDTAPNTNESELSVQNTSELEQQDTAETDFSEMLNEVAAEQPGIFAMDVEEQEGQEEYPEANTMESEQNEEDAVIEIKKEVLTLTVEDSCNGSKCCGCDLKSDIAALKADVATKFEKLETALEDIKTIFHKAIMGPEPTGSHWSKAPCAPADNEKDCRILERRLARTKYRARWFKFLKAETEYLRPKETPAKDPSIIGDNCCFILLDILFTRKCLTNYSWTGIARNDESKYQFSVLANILKLMLDVCNELVDYPFSAMQRHISVQLRNSKARSKKPIIRQPGAKRRQDRPQKLTNGTNESQEKTKSTSDKKKVKDKNVKKKKTKSKVPNGSATTDKDDQQKITESELLNGSPTTDKDVQQQKGESEVINGTTTKDKDGQQKKEEKKKLNGSPTKDKNVQQKQTESEMINGSPTIDEGVQQKQTESEMINGSPTIDEGVQQKQNESEMLNGCPTKDIEVP